MPDGQTSLLQLIADNAKWFWVVLLAMWGGTANYLAGIKKKNQEFSVRALIGEWSISGFAGVITAYLCVDAEMSFPLSAAFAGIAGHMGGRAILLIEEIITKIRRTPGRPENES